jgi:8-oxo-dGTP pyrophosphatase MutT (NUDIX family)
MPHRWKPNVTVAAVIERDHRFLLVEEQTAQGLRLNNPAGHLDPGESLVQACVRETLEETAFAFVPDGLVGVYLTGPVQAPAPAGLSQGTSPGAGGITYLRFAFCGVLGTFDARRVLDQGIVRTVWLLPQEIRDSRHLHRSPVLLRCVEDYLAGRRFPLDLVRTDLT